jgi:hypothetical protein
MSERGSPEHNATRLSSLSGPMPLGELLPDMLAPLTRVDFGSESLLERAGLQRLLSEDNGRFDIAAK